MPRRPALRGRLDARLRQEGLLPAAGRHRGPRRPGQVPAQPDRAGEVRGQDLRRPAGHRHPRLRLQQGTVRQGRRRGPKTWDDLKKAAATIKDKTGVDGYWGSTAGYYAQPFLYGEGTDTVDAEAKKVTVNSPEAKKAYGTWLSLFEGKGLHKADVTADAYAHIQDAFVSGKVASIIQGPWEITNFYKGSAFKDKDNLGIATVPAGSTGTAGAPTGGHNLSVYAGSDKAHQEASLKFVKFMTSAKSQETIALKNSTLPTRDDAYTAEVKADPGIAGYQGVLAAAQPRPALPEYSSLWVPLDDELPQIASGKKSLDKGLGDAEAAITKLVPDFGK